MRVKRSVRLVNGTSLLTETDKQNAIRGRGKTSQKDIDRCLDCTKPADKCRGSCKQGEDNGRKEID